MTGDDRLRAELRSLEEAAPADLPPHPAPSRSPRGWRLAIPAAVVVVAGALVGLGLPDWLERQIGGTDPTPSALTSPTTRQTESPAPSPSVDVPPAEALDWEALPFPEREAAFGGLELVGNRLVAVGSIDDEPAAWYSDDEGGSWIRATLNFRSLPRAPIDLRSLRSLVVSGENLIAIGSDEFVDPHLDHLWVSHDLGKTWTWTRSPTDQIASLTGTGERFLAFGLDIITYEERHESFWQSEDGTNWAPVQDDALVSRIRVAPLAEHDGVAVAALRTPRDPPSSQPPRVWVQRTGSPGIETAVADDPGGIHSVGATASGFVAAGYIGPIWEEHRAALWVSGDAESWKALPMEAESGSVASSSTSNELGMVIFGWFDVPQWALDFDRQYVWFSPGGTDQAVPQEVGGTIRAFIALDDRFIGLGETCDNEGNCHSVLFNAVAGGGPEG